MWLRPKYEELQNKQAALEVLQQELADTNSQVDLENSTVDLNLTATDRELLESGIPQGFDQDFLIETIQDIAEDNQISSISKST